MVSLNCSVRSKDREEPQVSYGAQYWLYVYAMRVRVILKTEEAVNSQKDAEAPDHNQQCHQHTVLQFTISSATSKVAAML